MDTEKQTHVVYLSHVAKNRQTFSLSLHTVTLHVIVLNTMSGYQAFKAAFYHHLHCKVEPKHHTTHCQNVDTTVQARTTVNTTMLHT